MSAPVADPVIVPLAEPEKALIAIWAKLPFALALVPPFPEAPPENVCTLTAPPDGLPDALPVAVPAWLDIVTVTKPAEAAALEEPDPAGPLIVIVFRPADLDAVPDAAPSTLLTVMLFKLPEALPLTAPPLADSVPEPPLYS
jgi:hypothetical protein